MWTVYLANNQILTEKDCNWKLLPNYPIVKLIYLFNGKEIILEEYEEYNHLIETSFNLLDGNISIRSIYLMGRKNGNSHVIRLNKLDNSILEYNTEIDNEYGAIPCEPLWINGRPSTGWKRGI
jgi:hypothetical protein